MIKSDEIDSLPSVSIVCVFNDQKVFHSCLEHSLKNQDHPCELIAIDNTQNAYSSATHALNAGVRRATGKYVIFVHQDVVFLEPDSLRCFLGNVLRIDGPSGWLGIAGRDHRGFWRGLLRDRDFISGEPFESHQEIQTLDELLLCRKRDQHCKFDESLQGWHAYGVDACCDAIRRGERNYVVATSLWHASKALNTAKLRESHEFIYRKHHRKITPIMTTCGRIPKAYEFKGGYRLKTLLQNLRWSLAGLKHRVRSPSEPVGLLTDLLDRLTLPYAHVGCLRGKYRFSRMEAVGFRDKTPVTRRVVHWFDPQTITEPPDALVVFPDAQFSDWEKYLPLDLPTIKILEVSGSWGRKTPPGDPSERVFRAESPDGRMYLVRAPFARCPQNACDN